MNNVQELYEAATELISRATLCIQPDESRILLIQAFELAREAALALTDSTETTKMRSKLFYESIKLAILLEEFNDAKELITVAQNGAIHEDYLNLIKNQAEILSLVNQI